MRIVFMGTAELACPSLEAVAKLTGHEVVLVVTQPDRPKGRDLQLSPPPVKVTAQKLGLPVEQPVKMREAEAIELVRAARPDLIVVVAYGQILPKTLLEIPVRGCINVHTSLLPRWRGASPIQQAILHGDAETGVTTMFLTEELDAGDIIFQRTTPVLPTDTGAILHDRLATIGAELLTETVEAIARGTAPRRAQDTRQVTYARKIAKEDGRIVWSRSAAEIDRQVRAFDPWPGTFAMWEGNLLKVWKVEVLPSEGFLPGEVKGDCVGTGKGVLRLLEVQQAGKKRMMFADFLRGHTINGKAVMQ